MSLIKGGNSKEEGLEQKNKFDFKQIMFMESSHGGPNIISFLYPLKQTHAANSQPSLVTSDPHAFHRRLAVYYVTGTFNDH